MATTLRLFVPALAGLAAGCAANSPPTIVTIEPEAYLVRYPDSIGVHAEATDPDGDPLTYAWTPGTCDIVGEGPDVTFATVSTDDEEPCHAGRAELFLTVDDGRGGQDTAYIYLDVEF